MQQNPNDNINPNMVRYMSQVTTKAKPNHTKPFNQIYLQTQPCALLQPHLIKIDINNRGPKQSFIKPKKPKL